MWKTVSDLTVETDASLEEVLDTINRSGIGLALVADDEAVLLGTITDGDVRRALLRGTRLSGTAEFVMNRRPVTAPAGASRDELLSLMRRRHRKQIPMLAHGKVVDVAVLDHLLGHEHGVTEVTTPVVVMCGGLGTRLRPLTDTIPKPLLPVRGRPLIEHTLERLAGEGFRRVFLAVYYRPEAFQEHGIEGSRWGIELEFVYEPRRLGTAGALGLMRDRLTEPFLIVNGDVFTQLQFRSLLDFHTKHDFLVTLGVKPYEVRIPYGVVTVNGDEVIQLVEKPAHTCLTNAGVYAMNPEVIPLIGRGERADMDEVIVRVIDERGRVGAFPVHESWTDIGLPATYEQAQRAEDER